VAVLRLGGRHVVAVAALTTWRGDRDNVSAAQAQYRHRARCTGAARRGEYSEEIERELVAD